MTVLSQVVCKASCPVGCLFVAPSKDFSIGGLVVDCWRLEGSDQSSPMALCRDDHESIHRAQPQQHEEGSG